MATLSSLVKALAAQPSEERRGELAQLAVDQAAHASEVLREAAELAAGIIASDADLVPLRQVLPGVAATAPAGRLVVSAGPMAERWLVHRQHTRQILINLLGNAARYSTGVIRLTARAGARRLRLTVADEGGPTRDLWNALNRRTPPVDDNGLGLWVVRQLTMAHGGTLRARPERPRGLVLEVQLPRQRT